MDIRRKDTVLDLACGQGFFAGEFSRFSGHVAGVDASKSLIAIARKGNPKIDFHMSLADSLPFITDGSIDKIAIILALQNIENVAGVLRECARVLRPDGSLYIVLNHPAFRVPKASSWGWDEKMNMQYRRIDKYLSESKVEIDMHPGEKQSEKTLSFHRPLQFYFKMLRKAGFGVAGLEEWNSHKKSESGPRAKAEDAARKEIPLFLCLIAGKAAA